MIALVGACDAIMLGKLSQNAMSAVSLATQVTFVFNLFMYVFVSGENMFVAQYYGKGDYKGISKIFSLVTKACGVVAVIFLIGTFFFPRQIMAVLTNEEELIVLGGEYLRVIGISYVLSSINPMYDFGHGDYAIGSNNERQDLYRRCEKEGVGISVMKPFNAGQLLDAAKSPFHQALTTSQCIQYALDKPGVLTVVGGPGNVEQLKEILTYLDTTDEERDYSVIGSFTPDDSVGKCVYCKHCHPCPAGLNIGLINKYYDLSRQGDQMAKDHYLTLEKTASDCIKCGHCNKRCPFKVQQQERMEEIKNYFGK